MFWSGNYIVVRELNSLLKEENVSLTQVLEADDILQECKADNKALIQFLTRPEILAELITLITEEPPKHVELSYQYRHASIACEVLTSHLSMLSDRLSMDTVQMHRLCDFINQEPPLNPLLASYFSKTVEMLLDRNPKQDWYFYHIVCLRVLDFFKSRRDFLPNLLRHLATSAIADTFKFFIRLDDLDNLFNKIVMEWLDEHQFLESLIQIMCGTYVPEPLPARGAEPERETGDHRDDSSEDEVKVSDHNAKETSAEKPEASRSSEAEEAKQTTEDDAKAKQRSIDRMKAVASANAAALLCDILLTGCAGEGSNSRPRTGWVLATRLLSPQSVAALLSGVFTSPPRRRQHALLSGCRLLQTLLDHHTRAEWPSVELALAPHLPLLHQALLHDPDEDLPEDDTDACAYRGPRPRVGLARIQVAALLAQLALSQAEEVAATMMTLGTPGALVSLMFAHPDTNLLHAHVHAYVARALANTAHRHAYTEHLLGECDLLTRLMDAFEENEEKKTRGEPRSGYMGHVVGMLSAAARADPPHAPPRWPAFRDNKLAPLLQRHDTALGGFYPSDNIYEMDNTDMSDAMATAYEYNDMMSAGMEDMGEDINNDVLKLMCTGLGSGEANELSDNIDPTDSSDKKERMLCNLPVSNKFGDDMWDEVEPDIVDQAVQDLFCDVSPWESRLPAEGAVSEGWAQFEAFADAPADDMFWRRDTTPDADKKDLEQNQTLNQNQPELRTNQGQSLEESSVELANNLLHAMSSMALDDIANIVNANLTDVVTTKPDSPKHVETTNEGKIDNESPVEKLSNESNNETSASTSVVENKSFADTNFGKQNSFAENENLAENKFPDTNFGENKNFADTSFGEKTYFAESTSVVENKGFADTNLGEKNSFESTSVVENKSISENTNVVENKSFTDTSVVENKSSENTSVVENKSSENTNIVEDKSVADTNFGENSFESTSVVENSSFSESTSCDNGSAGTEAQDSES